MTFIKFRFTLPPDFCEGARHTFIRIGLQRYLTVFAARVIVSGYETQDSEGKPTAPHIHCHFETSKNIETIRKALTRMWKEDGEMRTRASLYCLKEEKDVQDMNFFFRYPLKQCGENYFHAFNKYPTDFNVEQQLHDANEHWKMSCEVNCQKRKSLENRQSTYDKLVLYLESKTCDTTNDVVSHAFDFYLQEKHAMNCATIHGYCLTYSCAAGLVSKDIVLNKIKSFGLL